MQTKRKFILSTEDVKEELVDIYGDEMSPDQVSAYLDAAIKDKLVYVYGDVQSYRDIVRKQGAISWSEHNMQRDIQKGRSLGYLPVFIDTEFPITPDGIYAV